MQLYLPGKVYIYYATITKRHLVDYNMAPNKTKQIKKNKYFVKIFGPSVPEIAFSVEDNDAILAQYSKSYDLSRFAEYAKDAAKRTEINGNPINVITADNDKKQVDITQFSVIGDTINSNIQKNQENQKAQEALSLIQNAIGKSIADANLLGENGIREKYLALHEEIKKNSDDYHSPAQITYAFNQLRDLTLKSLKQQKDESIKKIKEKFQIKDPLTDNNKALCYLTGIEINNANNNQDEINNNNNQDEIKKKLQEQIDLIISHIEKACDDAENKVNEYYQGKTAQNDKEQDISGLNEKLEIARTEAEADLLIRIRHLELLEMHGYKLQEQNNKKELSATVGQGNDIEAQEEIRKKSLLKNISLKDLQQKTTPGVFFGEITHGKAKTRAGDDIEVEETNGLTIKASLTIPAQWFKSDYEWEKALQANMLDLVDQALAMKKDVHEINFILDHKEDKSRNMMIIAAYKAARLRGYKPGEIKLTVTGSKEDKNNFKSKPASEVIQALGLSAYENEINNEVQKNEQEKKKLNEKQQKQFKQNVENLKLSDNNNINTNNNNQPQTKSNKK